VVSHSSLSRFPWASVPCICLLGFICAGSVRQRSGSDKMTAVSMLLGRRPIPRPALQLWLHPHTSVPVVSDGWLVQSSIGYICVNGLPLIPQTPGTPCVQWRLTLSHWLQCHQDRSRHSTRWPLPSSSSNRLLAMFLILMLRYFDAP